jgi:hypothetical protein
LGAQANEDFYWWSLITYHKMLNTLMGASVTALEKKSLQNTSLKEVRL